MFFVDNRLRIQLSSTNNTDVSFLFCFVFEGNNIDVVNQNLPFMQKITRKKHGY